MYLCSVNHVIRHINYLVHRNDCVVMPGLGAFIARPCSASYDAVSGVMLPPRRELTFNGALSQNDGLLINSIARREGISYEQASTIVEREINSLRYQLAAEKEISLGAIGSLRSQNEASPVYMTSQNVIGATNLFLESIDLKPFGKKTEIAKIAHEHERLVKRGKKRRLGLKVAKVAASIALIAAVGVAVLTAPFASRKDAMASVAAIPSSGSVQTAVLSGNTMSHANQLFIAIPNEEQEAPATVRSEADVVIPEENNLLSQSGLQADNQSETFEQHSFKYCLVIASLPTGRDAERFIDESGLDGLGVVNSGGRYRVFAAQSDTQSELEKLKAQGQISVRYPDAWVCRIN